MLLAMGLSSLIAVAAHLMLMIARVNPPRLIMADAGTSDINPAHLTQGILLTPGYNGRRRDDW